MYKLEKNDFRNKKKKCRTLVLYDSKYGNTKKVANALIRGLEAGDNIVDSCSIHEYEIENILFYDVIGIGCPTHNRGMSKAMKAFMKKLQKINLQGKKAFVFETRLNVPLAGSSGKKIMKHVIKMKMKILHVLITGTVVAQDGPLEINTLKIMEQIGLKIAVVLDEKYKQKEVIVYEK